MTGHISTNTQKQEDPGFFDQIRATDMMYRKATVLATEHILSDFIAAAIFLSYFTPNRRTNDTLIISATGLDSVRGYGNGHGYI